MLLMLMLTQIEMAHRDRPHNCKQWLIIRRLAAGIEKTMKAVAARAEDDDISSGDLTRAKLI